MLKNNENIKKYPDYLGYLINNEYFCTLYYNQQETSPAFQAHMCLKSNKSGNRTTSAPNISNVFHFSSCNT